MEINKEKKQKAEDIERFFLAPSLRPFLGVTVTDKTDIEDEFQVESDDKTQVKKVQQTIHGRVFTTELVYEQKIDEEASMREESKITYVVPDGTRLVWEQGSGYVFAKENFQTLEEIEENYKLVKE